MSRARILMARRCSGRGSMGSRTGERVFPSPVVGRLARKRIWRQQRRGGSSINGRGKETAMHNVVRKLKTRTVWQEFGEVMAMIPNGIRVRTSVGEFDAVRAVGCLVE